MLQSNWQNGKAVSVNPFRPKRFKRHGQWILAKTDFDGNFCFVKIADGSYKLTVNYVGYKSVSKALVVKDGKSNPLKIEMESNSFP